MAFKCNASPQLLDQNRCFFCPGSRMHNNDIIAKYYRVAVTTSFVLLFGLHARSFPNIISTHSLVTADPRCLLFLALCQIYWTALEQSQTGTNPERKGKIKFMLRFLRLLLIVFWQIFFFFLFFFQMVLHLFYFSYLTSYLEKQNCILAFRKSLFLLTGNFFRLL